MIKEVKKNLKWLKERAIEYKRDIVLTKNPNITDAKMEKACALTVSDVANILWCDKSMFVMKNIGGEVFFYNWNKGYYTLNDIVLREAYYELTGEIITPATLETIKRELEERTLEYFPAEKRERGCAVFKNGLYKDGELLEHTPRFSVSNMGTIEYKKNAPLPRYKLVKNNGEEVWWSPQEIVDNFAQGDPERERLFWELVNVVIGNSYTNAFVYAWNEEGAGGKTTILEVFKALAGTVTQADISELGGRFILDGVEKSRLIAGPDGDANARLSSEAARILKTLVDGDNITTEGKGKARKSVQFHGLIYQASNGPFMSEDATGGVMRRLVLLPFKAIPTEKQIKGVSSVATTEESLEWFVSEAIKRFPTPVRSITRPKDSEKYIKEVKEDSSAVEAFLAWDRFNEVLEENTRIPHSFLFNELLPAFAREENDSEASSLTKRGFKKKIQSAMNNRGWANKQAVVKEEHFVSAYKDANGVTQRYYDKYGHTKKNVWVKEK